MFSFICESGQGFPPLAFSISSGVLTSVSSERSGSCDGTESVSEAAVLSGAAAGSVCGSISNHAK
ncbi:MAG TPA: hypothetical protein DCG51_13050 [Erysipelotrichaceae bacterium]|nr:hypothetical protein [Erysipelotrichaceae bacterium]